MARLKDDLALARRLRRARFDVVIDLHGGPRSAWLTWATRAPVRVGYRGPGRTWMSTDRVERSPEPSTRHSVLNQWDLLAPLGIPSPPDPAAFPVEMPPSDDADASVRTMVDALGTGTGDTLLVVHVSASNPFKRWPGTSFVETIVRLVQGDPTRYAAVVSGPSEPAAAEAIVAAARARLGADGMRVAAMQVDLAGLRALASRAAVYIGGDSGPLHVAATTRTPIVEILGPTVASRSFAWRSPEVFSETVDVGPLPCRPCRERTCAPGDFRCLTRLDPEVVVAAAERALASRDRKA